MADHEPDIEQVLDVHTPAPSYGPYLYIRRCYAKALVSADRREMSVEEVLDPQQSDIREVVPEEAQRNRTASVSERAGGTRDPEVGSRAAPVLRGAFASDRRMATGRFAPAGFGSSEEIMDVHDVRGHPGHAQCTGSNRSCSVFTAT